MPQYVVRLKREKDSLGGYKHEESSSKESRQKGRKKEVRP
jgi:hypothetical protein